MAAGFGVWERAAQIYLRFQRGCLHHSIRRHEVTLALLFGLGAEREDRARGEFDDLSGDGAEDSWVPAGDAVRGDDDLIDLVALDGFKDGSGYVVSDFNTCQDGNSLAFREDFDLAKRTSACFLTASTMEVSETPSGRATTGDSGTTLRRKLRHKICRRVRSLLKARCAMRN